MAAPYFGVAFAATGDLLPGGVPVALQPDGSISMSLGWGPDYELDDTAPGYKPVGRREMNSMFNGVTAAIGEIQFNGFPPYRADAAPYPINAIVRHNDLNYRSTVTNNSTVPGAVGATWAVYGAEYSLPQATEILLGGVKIATQAQVTTGTDDASAVTPKKLATALSSQPYSPGHFQGFTLANNSLAPNTTVDVGPGSARDYLDTLNIKTTTTLRGILQSSGGWVAGDNQNKLDAGAKSNSTWYHVFAIRKTSDGSADILFSLSPSAPTLPIGYAGLRWIGAVYVQSSGNLRQFVNVKDLFFWKDVTVDVISAPVAQVNIVVQLQVPTGVRVVAKIDAWVRGENSIIYARPTDSNTVVLGDPNTTAWVCGIGSAMSGSVNEAVSAATEVVTNAAGQIAIQTFTSTTNVGYGVTTKGYEVFR